MYFLLRCPLCMLIAFELMIMKHSSCAFRKGRFIFFLWFLLTNLWKRPNLCLRPSCKKKKNKICDEMKCLTSGTVLQVFCKTLRVWHVGCMIRKQRESYQVTISGAKNRKFAAVQFNILSRFMLTKQEFIKKITKNVFFLVINPTC